MQNQVFGADFLGGSGCCRLEEEKVVALELVVRASLHQN